MSAVDETHTHGFAAAIRDRDHPGLGETLAGDVVLHSAVTAAPFEGKETVSELYASVIESFEHVEVVDDFSEGDTYAFFWRGPDRRSLRRGSRPTQTRRGWQGPRDNRPRPSPLRSVHLPHCDRGSVRAPEARGRSGRSASGHRASPASGLRAARPGDPLARARKRWAVAMSDSDAPPADAPSRPWCSAQRGGRQ